MSDERKLIGLINEYCAGKTDCDVEELVNIMNGLIWRAFKRRGLAGDPGIYSQMKYEDFNQACWERLLRDLFQKLDLKTFVNDDELKKYTKKIFENMFIDEIRQASPGYSTRNKQINRVLKPLCIKDKYCWRLKTHENTKKAADISALLDGSKGLALPEMKSSQNKQSIPDREMANYLESLLANVGGMATKRDLISFIMSQYGHVKKEEEIPLEQNPASETEDKKELPLSDKSIYYSKDYVVIAEELFARMTSRMKDIYYLRIVKNITTKETAEKLGMSIGKVNIIEKKEYKPLFRDFFENLDERIVFEEQAIILNIVSCLIKKEEESS